MSRSEAEAPLDLSSFSCFSAIGSYCPCRPRTLSVLHSPPHVVSRSYFLEHHSMLDLILSLQLHLEDKQVTEQKLQVTQLAFSKQCCHWNPQIHLLLVHYHYTKTSFLMLSFYLSLFEWIAFFGNFCVWYEEVTQLFPFACGHPGVPAPFVEKTVVSPTELSWHPCQKSVDYKF